MSIDPADAVNEALRLHGRDEIHELFGLDCCIEASAIVSEVLDYFKIGSRLIYTQACILNLPAQAFVDEHGAPATLDNKELCRKWEEKNCKAIGLGFGGSEPGRYPGHIVTVSDRLTLYDLTLDQVRRLTHGIDLPPLIGNAHESFLRGGEIAFDVQNCWIEYKSNPIRDDFRQTPAWVCHRRRSPIVAALIRHAKHYLRQLHLEHST